MLTWRYMPVAVTTLQVALALVFLLSGTSVYLIARPASDAFMLPHFSVEMSSASRHWVALLAGSLPTFSHTIAFSLLTAVLALPGRRGALFACLLWLVIEVLFEVGQASLIAIWLGGVLPAWFEHVPILDHMGSYFLGGTFDPLDLAAAVLGTAVAYCILLSNLRRITS
jgi:hypothetical protein